MSLLRRRLLILNAHDTITLLQELLCESCNQNAILGRKRPNGHPNSFIQDRSR